MDQSHRSSRASESGTHLSFASVYEVPAPYRVARTRSEHDYSISLISRDSSSRKCGGANIIESSMASFRIDRTHIGLGTAESDIVFACNIRKTEFSQTTTRCSVSIMSNPQTFVILSDDGEAIIKPLAPTERLQAIFPFRGGIILQARAYRQSGSSSVKSFEDRFYYLVSAMSALTEIAFPLNPNDSSSLVLSCVYENESVLCLTNSNSGSVLIFYLVEKVADSLKTSKPSQVNTSRRTSNSSGGLRSPENTLLPPHMRKSTSRSSLSSPTQSISQSLKKGSGSKAVLGSSPSIPSSILKNFGYASSPTQFLRDQSPRLSDFSSNSSTHSSFESSSVSSFHHNTNTIAETTNLYSSSIGHLNLNATMNMARPIPSNATGNVLGFGFDSSNVFTQSQTLPAFGMSGLLLPDNVNAGVSSSGGGNYNSNNMNSGGSSSGNNYNNNKNSNSSNSNTSNNTAALSPMLLQDSAIRKQHLVAEFAFEVSCRKDVLFPGANTMVKIHGCELPLGLVFMDVRNMATKKMQRFRLRFSEAQSSWKTSSLAGVSPAANNLNSSRAHGSFLLSAAEEDCWPANLDVVTSASYCSISIGKSINDGNVAIRVPVTFVAVESTDEAGVVLARVEVVIGSNTLLSRLSSSEMILSIEDEVDVLASSQILCSSSEVTFFSVDADSNLVGISYDGKEYVARCDLLDAHFIPNRIGFRNLIMLLISRVRREAFTSNFISQCINIVSEVKSDERRAFDACFELFKSPSIFTSFDKVGPEDAAGMDLYSANGGSANYWFSVYSDSLKAVLEELTVDNGHASHDATAFLTGHLAVCLQYRSDYSSFSSNIAHSGYNPSIGHAPSSISISNSISNSNSNSIYNANISTGLQLSMDMISGGAPSSPYTGFSSGFSSGFSNGESSTSPETPGLRGESSPHPNCRSGSSIALRWDAISQACTPSIVLLKKFLGSIGASLVDIANIDIPEMEGYNYEHIARAIVDVFVKAGSPTTAKLTLLPGNLQRLVEISVLMSQNSPNIYWPSDLLTRNGRLDILRMRNGIKSSRNRLLQISTKAGHRALTSSSSSASSASSNSNDASRGDHDDGLAAAEDLSVLRFNRDERVNEVGRMLRSSAAHYLRVDRGPAGNGREAGGDEIDHRNRIQMRLLTLCRRSLACPVGRGMLTLASSSVPPADGLVIPPLSISGRVAPHNSIVSLDTSSAPPELTLWPEFHNGVATGLRIRGSGANSSGTSFNLDRVGGSMDTDRSSQQGQNPQWRGATGGSHRSGVSRNWILYNKVASTSKQDESSHAGLLLALGLQGHLSVLSIMDILEYATKNHDPTTIAILVGGAASKLGSADSMHSKTLTLHIPSLLPSRLTSGGVPLTATVQSAALAGLGLLHCGSAHRLMVEYLLSELTRAPSSDRVETREALVMAASWALGMILLGVKGCSTHKGDGMHSLSDLEVEDRLQLLIDGGQRPPESSLFPSNSDSLSDNSSRTSRILETDVVNAQVTAPGAIIALAMLHMRSDFSSDKNFNIADCSKIHGHILGRLAIPTTVFALNSSRPDVLFHRALGLALVLWDVVVPSPQWIEAQIPAAIRDSFAFFHAPAKKEVDPSAMSILESGLAAMSLTRPNSLPYDVVFTSYICIYSGYCLGLGLIHAGTMNVEAKATVLSYLKTLQSYRDNKSAALKKGLVSVIPGNQRIVRGLIEMCLCSTAIALSMICAGSGDIDCLRIVRELRWRVDDVLYGSHMALGMALGFLFLSGGDASLKRDPVSISCLLLSVLPRYPSRTVDNQFHLQPLRHLYVLAVESRALYALDADTLESVSVSIIVTFRNGEKKSFQVPCLLPELSTVQSLRVEETDKYFRVEVVVSTEYDACMNNASLSSLRHSRYSLPPLYLRRKDACNIRRAGTLHKHRLDVLVQAVCEEGDFNDSGHLEGNASNSYTSSSTSDFNSSLMAISSPPPKPSNPSIAVYEAKDGSHRLHHSSASPAAAVASLSTQVFDDPKVVRLLDGALFDFFG